MRRWGIILDRQLLFATNDERVALRFMAMGFRVIDHSTGYYAYTDLCHSHTCDLLTLDHSNTNG